MFNRCQLVQVTTLPEMQVTLLNFCYKPGVVILRFDCSTTGKVTPFKSPPPFPKLGSTFFVCLEAFGLNMHVHSETAQDDRMMGMMVFLNMKLLYPLA